MNYWMCCRIDVLSSPFSSSLITCVESGLLKVWKEGCTDTVSQCDFNVLQCLLYFNYRDTPPTNENSVIIYFEVE